jgi:hypothetical protein
MRVSALVSVWNASLWLPYSLRAIYPFVEQLVVIEACWVPGEWSGKTSPDGTAELVRKFIHEEDPEKKILFEQKGRCTSQPQARNFALRHVDPKADWLWQVDADEVYTPEVALKVRAAMGSVGPEVGALTLPAKCFYFDFFHFKREHFARCYRTFAGQKFYAIASMTSRGAGAAALAGEAYEYFHYSYVSPAWTETKACMGEDLPADQYRAWWENIYSQFDGSNLEELYEKNGGGIHVMGGGPLESYEGPHPAVMDSHPLRSWRWDRSLDQAVEDMIADCLQQPLPG